MCNDYGNRREPVLGRRMAPTRGLLAMTAICGVIATPGRPALAGRSGGKQSRWFRPGIEGQVRTISQVRIPGETTSPGRNDVKGLDYSPPPEMGR